eukprot:SAG22_NODE_9762_length_571_cov_0.591102_1_plen_71_part_00
MGLSQSTVMLSYLDVGRADVANFMAAGNTVANVPGVLVPLLGAWLRRRLGDRAWLPLFGLISLSNAIGGA